MNKLENFLAEKFWLLNNIVSTATAAGTMTTVSAQKTYTEYF